MIRKSIKLILPLLAALILIPSIDLIDITAGLEEMPPPGEIIVDEEVNSSDFTALEEVTTEKPITVQEFASLEELKAWLAVDDTNEYVYYFAGKDGVPQVSDKYDCDDYAFDLQKRAIEAGFLMSATIIQKNGQPHMINLVAIGNDIFYIEPQTDKVWFHCHRD